ncbi:hypothetical protein BN1708_020021, partial [Verticillium longisporum]
QAGGRRGARAQGAEAGAAAEARGDGEGPRQGRADRDQCGQGRRRGGRRGFVDGERARV